MQGSSFFTTLFLPQRGEWAARAEMLDPGKVTHAGLVREVMRAAREHRTVVLNGSLPREQVVAALVALRHGRRRRLVLADCTWSRGDDTLDRAVNRAGIRVIDRGDVTYCVLSSGERSTFPRNWGIDPARVAFTPWCYTLSDDELKLPVTDGGFVFAGGDSLRDYSPLLAAARGLDSSVTIATHRDLSPSEGGLPNNVQAGPVTHRRFSELTATAGVVVVPMEDRDDRSAGQGTYLNAMALGKPVVVSDVMGVRDYIEPGRTGLVVTPGDPGAMRRALDWVLAEANRADVEQIAARARRVVRERFGPEAYVRALLRTVDGSLT